MNPQQYQVLSSLLTDHCSGMDDLTALMTLTEKNLYGTLTLNADLLKVFAATDCKEAIESHPKGAIAIYSLEQGVGIDMNDANNVGFMALLVSGGAIDQNTHDLNMATVANKESLSSYVGLGKLRLGHIEKARTI